MLERCYLVGKLALVSIWFRIILTQIITTVYKDSPTIYQYMIGSTILIPTGAFYDTIIHVDYCYPCVHLYTSPTEFTMFIFILKLFDSRLEMDGNDSTD